MNTFDNNNKVFIIKEEVGIGFVYTFNNDNKVFIIKVRGDRVCEHN